MTPPPPPPHGPRHPALRASLQCYSGHKEEQLQTPLPPNLRAIVLESTAHIFLYAQQYIDLGRGVFCNLAHKGKIIDLLRSCRETSDRY